MIISGEGDGSRSEEAGGVLHNSARVASPLLNGTAALSLARWRWRAGRQPGSAKHAHGRACKSGLFTARLGLTALPDLRD